MTAPTSTPASFQWQVICLCAAWCGTCRDWEAPFAEAAAAHPHARFHWVDIEDEADTIGDVDVETFPTLLIAHEGRPLFFGPVLPSGGQLVRLLQSLSEDPQASRSAASEATGLLHRLQPLLLLKQ